MNESKKINLIQKAHSMFPKMPNEVFYTWLFPIIRDNNAFPYVNIFSSHPSEKWSRYFGLFTLDYISNLAWHKINLSFDVTLLDPLSNNTIDALIGAHVYGLETPARDVRNSKVRFDRCVEFINRAEPILAPIIGVRTGTHLRILDGNHRLAALTHLGLRGLVKWPAWVGV